ncbi:low affinity potassium transporter [Pseudogymnoascus australis]
MVFGLFLDIWYQVKAMKPSFLRKKPHFTFITVHYCWIIGLAIFGSILLFIPGNIRYIDALFFATGACTQSGLNPIDTNLLKLYQQIVMYILVMMTNPITINTSVVFLRLYWFEKRFQRIVKDAKRQRRSTSKSRSRSQMKGERDIAMGEHGVRGRKIMVMHGATRPDTAGKKVDKERHAQSMNAHSRNMNDYGISFDKLETESKCSSSKENPPPLKTHLTIKFADQVQRGDGLEDEHLQMPARRDTEAHIAFLERQRNRNDGVLRIPGPRDADRGVAPETIGQEAQRTPTPYRRASDSENIRQGLDAPSKECEPQSSGAENGTPGHGNTIDGHPNRVATEPVEAAVQTLGNLKSRKSSMMNGDKYENGEHLTKRKSGDLSLSMLRDHFSKGKEPAGSMPYISFQPTIGRNSAFIDLSEAQREELGGIEYRSLKTLAMVLVSYYSFFTVFATICLVPWIINSDRYGVVVEAAGLSRTWWGFFTAASGFNDLGFTLTADSMVSFQTAIFPLLLMSFLILIGNTGFPILLRWIIWIGSKLAPRGSGIWEELKFLLDHPRRCFTLLFPASATWWLFCILAGLNGVDLLLFIILDLGNPVVEDLSPNIRVLDGWFQATCTRTAGFSVVDLGALHPAIQFSYMIMMYISVFPIAISVRRTNVYEEQSLGIWGGSAADAAEDETQPSHVGSHVRRQLSFDLWFVALGWFFIAIAEGSRLQDREDPSFNLFSVLFEVISAYGTVGLSLGYPGTNTSFSAQFGTVGKLIILAMQVRGRHRGLPYELDRAILLPSESLNERDMEEEAATRRRLSFTGSVGGEDLRTANTNSSNKEKKAGETTKGVETTGSNFLSSMLHPGPSMAPRHRYTTTRREESYMRGEGRGQDGGERGRIAEGLTRSSTHHPITGGREDTSFEPLKKRMSV